MPSMPATPVGQKPMAALCSQVVCKDGGGRKARRQGSVTRPSERPTRIPAKMLHDFVATTSLTTTGMSITRLTGFTSALIALALVCVAMPCPGCKEHQRDAVRSRLDYLKRVTQHNHIMADARR